MLNWPRRLSHLEKNSKVTEKSRLGRGLSSLIPPTVKAPVMERPSPAASVTPAPPPPAPDPVETESSVQQIPLSKIVANAYQPRTEFDVTALQELTESVTVHGVLQPIMVPPAWQWAV